MKIKILSIALTVAVLCSCSKNETNFEADVLNPPMLKTINVLPDMLTFDTYEDYEETRDYVNSLSDEERYEWFAMHDEFSSFGRERDEMYFYLVEEYHLDEIDEMEVYAVVNDHRKYMQIVTDTIDGEINLFIDKCEEADGNDDYYIMNENCVYAIGDSVYRWYDTTLLIVPTSFYQTLMNSGSVAAAETAAQNNGTSIRKCFREGERGRNGTTTDVGVRGTTVREGRYDYQIRVTFKTRFFWWFTGIDHRVYAIVSNVRKKADKKTWVLHRLRTNINEIKVDVQPYNRFNVALYYPVLPVDLICGNAFSRNMSYCRLHDTAGYKYAISNEIIPVFPHRSQGALVGWSASATNSKGCELNVNHNINE